MPGVHSGERGPPGRARASSPTCWAGFVYVPQRHMHWRFEWMSHFLTKLAIYTYPQILAVFSPLQLSPLFALLLHSTRSFHWRLRMVHDLSLEIPIQTRIHNTLTWFLAVLAPCRSCLAVSRRSAGRPRRWWSNHVRFLFLKEIAGILVAFLVHILS